MEQHYDLLKDLLVANIRFKTFFETKYPNETPTCPYIRDMFDIIKKLENSVEDNDN